MKKITAIVLSICLILSMTLSCFATTYIENKEVGLKFIVPNDDWTGDASGEEIVLYHLYASNEGVNIFSIANDIAWDMSFIEESDMRGLGDELLSNEILAQQLSSENGVYVTITTDSVKSSYETYNNVTYYRYEKAYTARATGYYDTPFYETMFITARNGKFFFIKYQRDSMENHFRDVSAMLDTMSYDISEVKIKIDNERIYPDTSPMILNGRTLVPIRAVAEKMGYVVGWDEDKQIVSLTSYDQGNQLYLQIGVNQILRNEDLLDLDVAPFVLNGRTYLPLRAVAEAMDATVNWNEAENTVEIWK